MLLSRTVHFGATKSDPNIRAEFISVLLCHTILGIIITFTFTLVNARIKLGTLTFAMLVLPREGLLFEISDISYLTFLCFLKILIKSCLT